MWGCHGYDSDGFGHYTLADKSGNEFNGDTTSTVLYNIPEGDTEMYEELAVTSNGQLEDVPDGYVLEKFMITNTHAANTATLSLGTTSGGTELFDGETFAALTTVYWTFSLLGLSELHISDTNGNWNSCTVNIKGYLRQIEQK